jgi:hypothetical protein
MVLPISKIWIIHKNEMSIFEILLKIFSVIFILFLLFNLAKNVHELLKA